MIHFTKMHGAGNDYIYVYTPDNPIEDPAEFSRKWSQQHFGIGSDGLIMIGKSDIADFSMRIFNNDGSEAMMCGNGIRCVGKYVWDHKLIDRKRVSVDTLSGIKIIDLKIEGGLCTGATVNMGRPALENQTQFIPSKFGGNCSCSPLQGERAEERRHVFVSMGNPHFVVFVPDVENFDVATEGSQLEYDKAFPERCNIEFATILPDGTIRMRVWERGSGITLACGTGACATAVAACLTGRSGNESDVMMDGGTLHIRWDREEDLVYMTGPATTVFQGTIDF